MREGVGMMHRWEEATLRLGSGLLAFAATMLLPAVAVARDAAPRNDLPQPYETTRDWGTLPAGMKWAAVTAVESAPGGVIYVIHRCYENSCIDRPEPPILKFDAQGRLLKAFGQGLFRFPHGATVDPQGNLWVTDLGSVFLAERGSGDNGGKIVKFDPDGKVLMTLGHDALGSATDFLDQPNDIVVTRKGDFFVSESHSPGGKNNRVLKFSKDGKFIGQWGRKGSGPGEFSEPHSLALDSRGRLFVADRENNRIQIFSQDGKFLAQWHQFGRPSGIYIDGKDRLYVADSESSPVEGRNQDARIRRGIRIGSARTGRVDAFIEDAEAAEPRHSGAEGVGVDDQGNVYGAVVGRRMLERHVKRPKP